jgi:hypothetical protein
MNIDNSAKRSELKNINNLLENDLNIITPIAPYKDIRNWLFIIGSLMLVIGMLADISFRKNITGAIVEIFVGFIPGSIAGKKGYNFMRWWLFGCLFPIIAAPWSFFLKPKYSLDLVEKTTIIQEIVLVFIVIIDFTIQMASMCFESIRVIVNYFDILLFVASCLAIWSYYNYYRHRHGISR